MDDYQGNTYKHKEDLEFSAANKSVIERIRIARFQNVNTVI